MFRICSACKKEKPLTTDEFYYNPNAKRKSNKWAYKCRDCTRQWNKEYNKTKKRRDYNKIHQERLQKEGYFKRYNQQPENKKRMNEYQRKRWNDPKQRVKNFARDYLNKQKNNGTIKQQPCAMCQTENEMQAHHFDYEQPLFVVWLCKQCHRKEHERLKKAGVE